MLDRLSINKKFESGSNYFWVKIINPVIPIIVLLATVSLAKNFLQSYQGISRNLSARILLESEINLYVYYPSKYLFRKVVGYLRCCVSM